MKKTKLKVSEADVQQAVVLMLEPRPRYGGTKTHRPNAAWDGLHDSVIIVLSRGYTAQVDRADYDVVEGIRWNPHGKTPNIYAYGYSRAHGKNVFMHKLIMGDVDGPQVDHRDGNGLNNRRGNLREATGSGNCANRFHKREGYRGVSEKDSGKFTAKIKHAGKTTHLGTFATRDEAARVYDAKAREIWGEFARTNFV